VRFHDEASKPLAKPDRPTFVLNVHSEISPIGQGKRSFIETSRRALIVEYAIAAIAELGFARASLAQIARRAKVSTGVILYYFAGREDLIREVAAHAFAAGEAFVRPRVDPSSARRALLSFITASVAFMAANPKTVLAVMNVMRAGRSESGAPGFDAIVTELRRAGFGAIPAWGQATGEFRPLNIRVMVATIIEALDAIPPELADEPDLDLDAYARELVELFDRATRNDAACASYGQPTQT
jgi:AcrR family transcriptional regulator